MAQMKLIQSAANERVVQLFNQSLSQQINKFIIHKDYDEVFSKNNKEPEVFLITHSDDVYAFGSNAGGRLGFGYEGKVKEPTIIPELCGKNVIDIKCGYIHCVALTQTGQIYTFGTGNGDNDIKQKPIEISVDDQTITAIDCTAQSTFVLTQSGQLYWFGEMNGYYPEVHYPTKVDFHLEVEIKNISCGEDHILAQTVDGKVFSWGNNKYGQLGLGHNAYTERPQMIELKENIKQISCGQYHSLLLTTDGKVYSMGSNQYGQLGTGHKNKQNIPQLVLSDQKEICCYEDISMSLDENKKLYIWGNVNNEVSPVSSELTSFQKIVDKYADYYSTLDTGYLKVNESLKYPELFSIESNLLKEINKFIIYTDFKGTSVFLITHSDDVYAFGSNNKGRLGLGHEEEVKEPKIIPELCGKNVIDIKCGWTHCVGLTQTGLIYTFGYSSRTGNGDNSDIQKPTEISVDDQTITAIDCTWFSTFVLTQSGQLYWFGMLNGIQAHYPTKVVFPLEVEIKNISCGNEHILAQTVDGKVFSWGINWFGQLGLSYNNWGENIPQMIELNDNIKQISCGGSHSLLLTISGKLYSMGNNKYGQLGIGNKLDQNIPQLVLSEQKEICCYRDISMSLDENNKSYIWGNIVLVSPVKSELSSFQEVINKYSKQCSTIKPIEGKHIEEFLQNIEN